MAEKLIKSRKRVRQNGEVFTPVWMVKKMLSEPDVQERIHNLYTRFLEPSAGEGAFLIEILRQKLDYVTSISSKVKWRTNALWAIASIYGVELMQDNVDIARKRMLDVAEQYYRKVFDVFLLSKNIVQGNFLTGKNIQNKDIVFTFWKPIDNRFVRREDIF